MRKLRIRIIFFPLLLLIGMSHTWAENNSKTDSESISCHLISEMDKVNPITKEKFSFFTLAEDTSSFQIKNNESVFVIGDLHGSWQVIEKILQVADLVELDSPNMKNFSVKFSEKNEESQKIINERSVEIPNYRFKIPSTYQKKENISIVFMGDYIGKNQTPLQLKTLALLSDIMKKQKDHLQSPVIRALLGNHELEAINGVYHPGYFSEKKFHDQILSMVKQDFLIPTYYHNGIWYSHSYLTKDDISELSKIGLDFPKEADLNALDQLTEKSQDINLFIKNLIVVGGNQFEQSWLSSASESPTRHQGPFNFFYAMSAEASDSNDLSYSHKKFSLITGHLQDMERKTIRVLTEGYHGKNRNEFPNRDHILCVDTAICNSRDPEIIKINYNKEEQSVSFYTCKLHID